MPHVLLSHKRGPYRNANQVQARNHLIRELFTTARARSLTDLDIARLSGWAVTTVIQIRLGHRTPKLQTMFDLAEAVGLELILKEKS